MFRENRPRRRLIIFYSFSQAFKNTVAVSSTDILADTPLVADGSDTRGRVGRYFQTTLEKSIFSQIPLEQGGIFKEHH